MKIVYNNIIPFKGYKAVNLFGVLFVRKEAKMSQKDLTHEAIHTAQMRETLYVFFYLWYAVEWLVKVFRYWNFHTAYRHVSFEQEAYLMESVDGYDKNRAYYNWLSFVFN